MGQPNFTKMSYVGPQGSENKKGLRRSFSSVLMYVVMKFHKAAIKTECCETFFVLFSIFQNCHFYVKFYIGI